jgi:hypothetical protein
VPAFPLPVLPVHPVLPMLCIVMGRCNPRTKAAQLCVQKLHVFDGRLDKSLPAAAIASWGCDTSTGVWGAVGPLQFHTAGFYLRRGDLLVEQLLCVRHELIDHACPDPCALREHA